MANHIWGYGWELFGGDYAGDGFARVSQSVVPPVYVDPGSTPPPPPPPPPFRLPGVTVDAYGRVNRTFYKALTPGAIDPITFDTIVLEGQDRVVLWRSTYEYHGKSVSGECQNWEGVNDSQWSYAEPAESPLLLAVPDIMASPDLGDWTAIGLRVTVALTGDFKAPWGVDDPNVCELVAMTEGSATTGLLSGLDPAVNALGAIVGSAPPATGFVARMGTRRPPAGWPPYKLRVAHDFNTILVNVTINAYVGVQSRWAEGGGPDGSTLVLPDPDYTIVPGSTGGSPEPGGNTSLVKPPCTL